jgi:NAD(P)-dependent dehydrogenase (short-subunit alcohol dehydrogenase family)
MQSQVLCERAHARVVVCVAMAQHPKLHARLFEHRRESACCCRYLASAEDIARTILFIASEDASCMTGSVVVVDGGYTAQ